MSAPDLDRFDELLSRYLDASLVEADERELLAYLSDEILVVRFREATQLSTEIAGVLAGSIPNEVMVSLVLSDLAKDNPSLPGNQAPIRKIGILAPANTRAKNRRTPLLLALAAMVVVLAIVATRQSPHAPTPGASVTPAVVANAQVSSVHGEVFLIRSTGRVSLTAGLPLNDGGTIQTVGPGSHATVGLRDGSTIEMKGDTIFTADLGSGERRLFLQQGMLIATVTKQPVNAPLIFHTGRAMATVRGTELALVEEKSGTYLIVAEGAVALQRSSGGPEVLIEAGFYGHVELDGPFHPFPISRLPRAVRDQLPEN